MVCVRTLVVPNGVALVGGVSLPSVAPLRLGEGSLKGGKGSFGPLGVSVAIRLRKPARSGAVGLVPRRSLQCAAWPLLGMHAARALLLGPVGTALMGTALMGTALSKCMGL